MEIKKYRQQGIFPAICNMFGYRLILIGYEEKDYTEVDNKIELLNLKPRDRAILDCYMAGMTCNEIAEFLYIDRITVWRRRTRAQVKYKALFF